MLKQDFRCLFQTRNLSRNLSEESCWIPRKFVFTCMVDLEGKIQLFLGHALTNYRCVFLLERVSGAEASW